MSEEKYTRCPGCATVFRVTSEQLAIRAGQVRCGHCKKVFDGNAQRVTLAAQRITAARTTSESPAGPATATLPPRNAPALEPPDILPEATGGTLATRATTIAYDERFAMRQPKSRRTRAIVYGLVTVVLIALIAAQAVYHFRDAIAARWPVAQPALTRACTLAGCTIRPLRDPAMTHLSIDASDLQADSAHRGLLILSATLRNRAAWSLAYPYLELTLTDAQDQIVVRRALAPADYAGGTADLQRGIPPNGEVVVKVFIDASATTQAGYRLYMFYP
jgi:predicted Zn finger-like uncharacterized protein